MAADSGREYTSWAVVGAGEGGGRIASQFLTRTDNPGIEDRIVIINTARTDIQQTLDRVERKLAVDRDTLGRKHVADFGSKAGVGNDFLQGEECAQEDFDAIFAPISNTLAGSDAFLYTLGLGGGTGNGSVPYIVERLAGEHEGADVERYDWIEGLSQLVLAAWPYREDRSQQHFNAVCGLSRLLQRESGVGNADLTLLASNSHLEEASEDRLGESTRQLLDGTQRGRNDVVNAQIIPAVDLLISAGRQAVQTIDVNDFIRQPQMVGAYHATFGTAIEKPWGLDTKKYIEMAAENTFVPMDVSTCESAYVVFRAPERLIDDGEVTMGAVRKAFGEWSEEHGIRDAVGMPTLARKEGPGRKIDVLLILGGFELEPLLEQSWDFFTSYRDRIQNTELGRERAEEIRSLEQNLEEYRRRLDD